MQNARRRLYYWYQTKISVRSAMATSRLSTALHCLLRRVAPATPGAVSDAELLEELTKKYPPMEN